ncbi:hypothetical protein AB1Y20_014039 [Prymnesium parvum]|uniref:Class I SAM-dependent methyltransferase n=1 Tax=Prymnesium parvum TaxID=97485 RepID=A0AB34IEV9_PRYPA
MASVAIAAMVFANIESQMTSVGEMVHGDHLVETLVSRSRFAPFTRSRSAERLRWLANTTLRFTPDEATEWFSHLVKAHNYLEWGSGGTTVIAAWIALDSESPSKRQRLTVHSVEHASDFVEHLRTQNPLILPRAEAMGSLHFHIPDIGPTGAWGRPSDWSGREPQLRLKQAKRYVEPQGVSCCFDVILIDGRFREACAMHALRLSHKKTVVMMHDYNKPEPEPQDIRKYPRTVERWYDILYQNTTLTVLRPKPQSLAIATKNGEGSQMFRNALEQRETDDYM